MESNDVYGDDYHFESVPQTIEDNGSSNFGFDDNLTYEQSNEKEETNQTDETTGQDAFLADPDLDNANSLPSACDDNSVGRMQNESDSNQAGFMDVDYQTATNTNDRSGDTIAQSEDTKPGDPDATSLDAENISEDELPGPAKPEVKGAEEVSDEELPGPKMAELPADTEVVSEDELPAPKKRKHEGDYDPSEPTDETDEKKTKSDDDKSKHRLPDLDKYWKAVKADQEDFNAWTYLLQYVDSENDVEAAREAYDKFLSRYCYCYGYWRKYSDYEKKKGSAEKCEEVSPNTIQTSNKKLGIYFNANDRDSHKSILFPFCEHFYIFDESQEPKPI
jgi:hypothetical protein